MNAVVESHLAVLLKTITYPSLENLNLKNQLGQVLMYFKDKKEEAKEDEAHTIY